MSASQKLQHDFRPVCQTATDSNLLDQVLEDLEEKGEDIEAPGAVQ